MAVVKDASDPPYSVGISIPISYPNQLMLINPGGNVRLDRRGLESILDLIAPAHPEGQQSRLQGHYVPFQGLSGQLPLLPTSQLVR
jgi:hypothetical protein